ALVHLTNDDLVQFRDLIISEKTYPGSMHDKLVPCSDMAGEIVAVGALVKGWTVGNRVCANFYQELISGDLNTEISETALGGSIDGVFSEYCAILADVSSLVCLAILLTDNRSSRSSKYRPT
ncbi:hypothetical protein DPZ16_34545, partial [Klebsiella pneumoniae]